MADITYYTISSIPSPKDVIELPSSTLFINSVMASSQIVDLVTADNYKSYIAAIAKFASKNIPWKGKIRSRIRQAANNLKSEIERAEATPNTLETMIVKFLQAPEPGDEDAFLKCFGCFKEQIIS